MKHYTTWGTFYTKLSLARILVVRVSKFQFLYSPAFFRWLLWWLVNFNDFQIEPFTQLLSRAGVKGNRKLILVLIQERTLLLVSGRIESRFECPGTLPSHQWLGLDSFCLLFQQCPACLVHLTRMICDNKWLQVYMVSIVSDYIAVVLYGAASRMSSKQHATFLCIPIKLFLQDFH